MRFALVATLALAALALAGCSSDSGDGSPIPPQDEEGRYIVQLPASGNRFLPQHAEIPVGATVVWVNEGSTPHDVKADDGSFNSDSEFPLKMKRGDEFEHTFTTAGDYRYTCHLHEPHMWGLVHVIG